MINKTEQKIINNFNRGNLGEGRNYGLGYSILKKINSNTYETLMAFTACKDYLNDFMYIEANNTPLEKIYGFEHKYTGILKDSKHFYLGLKPLNTNNSNHKHQDYDKIQSNLKDNYNNIIKLLNKLETLFKTDNKTIFIDYFDDTLILQVPIYWSQFSWLFSFYGLFLRCFLDCTDKETKLDIDVAIKERKSTLISCDYIMMMPMKKYFQKFNLKKLLNFNYPNKIDSNYIHNNGINHRFSVLNNKDYYD